MSHDAPCGRLSRCIAASNNISSSAYTHDSLGNRTRIVKDGAPVLFTKNFKIF